MLPQRVLHMYKEEAKKKPKFLGDYMVSEKKDGWWAGIDYINDRWQVPVSRAGRAIPAFQHVPALLNDLFIPDKPCRFIAEATIPEIDDFHTVNGIFNRSVGEYLCYDAVFNFHDLVYFDEIDKPALERYDDLCNILTPIQHRSIELHVVDNIEDSKDKWLAIAKQYWEQGKEGVVLKHTASPYYPDKRNSSLMKIKLEERFVLYCVDVFYTIGEKGHSNLNATFRRTNGTEVIVRIGKHSDIAKIEEDKNYILGQPCLIECMCEVTPGGALREPRFKNVLDRTKFPTNDVKLKSE